MTFKVSDFHDLVVLLEQHPQWRAELRRLVLTEDILALPQIVQELAAGMVELRASVRELTEAQKRSEAETAELRASVRELAVSVRELAEAQMRTEARVGELATIISEIRETQKGIQLHLARLDNRIGLNVEEEAAGVLRVVLERKGYRAVESEFNLRVNGDVDVVLPLENAQGQRVWAVLEAKLRLSGRAVETWSNRMRSPDFQDALRKAGIQGPYLVYSYGMRIDLSAREAAEKFGIGLLGSQGEQVPPSETRA